MKLRLTPCVTRDLEEIADYLHTRNPSVALAVRDALLRSLQNLTLFPAIGRPQNVEGVRKLVTPKYRYLVYYMIDDGAEEIVILTIQHPRAVVNTRTSNSSTRTGFLGKHADHHRLTGGTTLFQVSTLSRQSIVHAARLSGLGHVASHGLRRVRPQPAKSPTSRVARSAPATRAVAAICASKASIGRPSRRRAATISA